jgi:hypothetical protein
MLYSDSTHFSDPKTYKILFISSYQTKDVSFAKLTHLQEFSEKQRTSWVFSHPREASCSG